MPPGQNLEEYENGALAEPGGGERTLEGVGRSERHRFSCCWRGQRAAGGGPVAQYRLDASQKDDRKKLASNGHCPKAEQFAAKPSCSPGCEALDLIYYLL